MAAESEKIYECQVKRRRLKLGGGYEPFWKLKSVTEALIDDDTEFRCPDCTGAVKLTVIMCRIPRRRTSLISSRAIRNIARPASSFASRPTVARPGCPNTRFASYFDLAGWKGFV